MGHAPSRVGAWDSGCRRKTSRGSVFGSDALRKVVDLLFTHPMMWSVLENIAEKKKKDEKVSGKYRRKNVDGDEGFLTTIWLTGKL